MERLVRQLEQPLYYFVRRIVAHDADAWDVMQEVWIWVRTGCGRRGESRTSRASGARRTHQKCAIFA
jgi:DNA-directed RNA polymerase specialized sigma24 family protein